MLQALTFQSARTMHNAQSNLSASCPNYSLCLVKVVESQLPITDDDTDEVETPQPAIGVRWR